MACTDSLKPFFDWSKQTEGFRNTAGSRIFPVFVTLTIHSSTFVPKKLQHAAIVISTDVEYVVGELQFMSKGSKEKEHLYGKFTAYVNNLAPGLETAFARVNSFTFEIKVLGRV